MSDKKNKGGRPRVEPHKCDHCEFTTKEKPGLRYHYLVHHASPEEIAKEPYCCSLCDFKGICKADLTRHQQTKKHQRIIRIVNELTQNS